MSNRDDQRSDTESILMALDQISQTIDVMTAVVGRLRSHVQARAEADAAAPDPAGGTEVPADRILH